MLLQKLHDRATPWWSWWSGVEKIGVEQCQTGPKYRLGKKQNQEENKIIEKALDR
jgi:hypothetical protein